MRVWKRSNNNLNIFFCSDQRTFTQQYQILSNYYKKGGPIFLIVGSEQAILPYEIYVSSVNSYFAPALHAFVIATEHRYENKQNKKIIFKIAIPIKPFI
jgi:Serine carboxypeptidase S28